MHDTLKLFLTVDANLPVAANVTIVRLHEAGDHEGVEQLLRNHIGERAGLAPDSLRVQTLPRIGSHPDETEQEREETDTEVTIGLEPMPRAEAERLLGFLQDPRSAPGIQASADLPIGAAEMWCPSEAASPLFGTFDRARALLGADALDTLGADGTGVQVVIVDQGLDPGYFNRATITNAKGQHLGWSVDLRPKQGNPMVRLPFTAQGRGHGTRMAELVLKLAPQAKIHDLPMLPDQIHDLRQYLHVADAAMRRVRKHLWRHRPAGGPLAHPGPWVLCNAWAVFDLAQDLPQGKTWSYARNPDNPFLRKLVAIALGEAPGPSQPAPGADVVFAAGNCGQFCPDPRCGEGSIGPGNSIYGAAALSRVLTVGAVRSDGMWLGYAAQGPAWTSTETDSAGLPIFSIGKPNVVAPSQFADEADPAVAYTGTSAACALAAGAVAALRSPGFGPSPTLGDPYALIGLLEARATELPWQAQPYDLQAGHGVLNLAPFKPAGGGDATAPTTAFSARRPDAPAPAEGRVTGLRTWLKRLFGRG